MATVVKEFTKGLWKEVPPFRLVLGICAALAVSVIAGLTGSASGGQSIALPLIAPHYIDQGVDPEALHRVVAISSGGLDSLPHNGYVVTTLRSICREVLVAPHVQEFAIDLVMALKDGGIDSKVPFHLPHRVAAARAGLGTFGKNCLFYSNKVVGRGSWVLPIAVVVDQEFAPDEPTLEVGCPEWCRNACLTACPTGALKGPRHINPRKCISFLTYYEQGITPLALREPMGLWVYGCDRCQNICPRNAPWLAKELPLNQKTAAMVDDFKLSALLHMDSQYFNMGSANFHALPCQGFAAANRPA